ncbi:MFS transporter [Chondromyces apiculatus]|uniref:Major facilitator superfamily (MFS) profile domain-containing protein n=1 Tax=Chondromyces apiculatus DSM 436 TaxID=1192034 RepID=A0A017TJ88_9BACT|nr:MFS transporter [Chondromyces apiculatus]EYF08681.1 Hypothetical protein CAP_2542 [Chondromyces apiculatus DSM 436]
MAEGARLPLGFLAALSLSVAVAPLNSTMIAVALPEMARTLPAESATLRQGLVTSYLLTNIVLQSPGGKLADRVGHRRTLALGQILFAVGAAAAYLVPVLPVLVVARMLMAAGGAVIAPSVMALLRTELPPESRARAFGAFGALMGLCAAVGPKVGALLVGHFGWRSIFLANVPVLLLSAILRRATDRQRARENERTMATAPAPTGGAGPAPAEGAAAAPAPRKPFDVVGSVLLGVSLLGLVLGLENPGLRWAAALGALGLVPFALWERRVADPVIDFSLFRRPAFVGGGVIIALQNLGMYAVMFELPQVAGRLFSVGQQDVGNTLVAMMGSMLVATALGGRAAERFGERAMALAGCVLNLSGMVLLGTLHFDALTDAIPALILLGAGLGLASAPAQSAAMSDVPRDRSGMAAGVTSTMRYIGGVTGVSLLGIVLTESTTRAVVLREHATAITLFCGALVIAALCALLLPKRVVTAAAARH